MIITLLTNNLESWFWQYNKEFAEELENLGFQVNLITKNEDLVCGGDFSFFLACTNIVPAKYLQYHQHNLVIHHSELPKGRGSSPLVWQVIEGENEIVFTLFEAEEKVDTGNIFMQKNLKLEGHELLDEIFYKRWLLERSMILNFLDKFPNVKSCKQEGEETIYRRRNFKDDELPINQTLDELFNRFRIVDNDKWPLYFYRKGHKYYLKIFKG